MRKKKINQLALTLIDNMPTMMDNHWYSGWDEQKPTYKGRYRLNILLLTAERPIRLQSTLSWPPSDLARRARWRDHADFYEPLRRESQLMKEDITRPSRIPPLLGMPSEQQTFKSKTKGSIFKWYMPHKPSLIRAQALIINNELSWNIQWIFDNQTLEFVIDSHDCQTERWENKEDYDYSLVYKKTYKHGFNLDPEYYMPEQPEFFIQEDIDLAYEAFKARVQDLFARGLEEEARHVMNQYQAYTDRWVNQ